MSEWQPIETAPKDGSYILIGKRQDLWVWDSAPVCVGFWNEGQNKPRWQTTGLGRIVPDVWSHWMPLPAPPIDEATEKTTNSLSPTLTDENSKGKEGVR